MKELQYLNKYFVKYKYRFLLGIVITIVAQIFKLYVPKFFGDSIRAIENASNFKEETQSILFQNFIYTLIVALIGGFLTFLMRQTLIVMSRHIEFDLKNDIYKHYQTLTQRFYKKNRTGA